MDITSLRGKIRRLIQTHSSSFINEIERSNFSCARCGWCCRRNFDIKINDNISRPSNAISIFPGDIRRIIKMTGHTWEEVAEPDKYSCFSEGDEVLVIGWILKRNEEENCVFYRNQECMIYNCRPLICRCYPFFMGEEGIEIMYCEGLEKNTLNEKSLEISRSLKRYEIKKLHSYIRIIKQIGDKLNIAAMKSLPEKYSGDVLVFDGESVSRCKL
ncbi:MAG: YkgJ family cysteine cluster protein [Candidatus Methanoperedens sp.]|nr:YkgJ family cysteine cluster protein [Candidatus Methanoperedens sp.]